MRDRQFSTLTSGEKFGAAEDHDPLPKAVCPCPNPIPRRKSLFRQSFFRPSAIVPLTMREGAVLAGRSAWTATAALFHWIRIW